MPEGHDDDAPSRQREARLFEIEETRCDDGTLRLTLSGELDLVGAELLGIRLKEIQRAATGTRLDLSGLEFIDLAGLRSLLEALEQARQGGWELTIDHRVSAPVSRLIELVRLGERLWASSSG